MASSDLELLTLCIAACWLGGAMLLARANLPKETYQLRRVPRAAATFVAGHAVTALVPAALSGQLDIIRFHVLLIGLLILGMISFLWMLVVDLVALLLRATRTPPWLAGGVLMFVLCTYAWRFFVGAALTGGAGMESPIFVAPGLIAAAAALLWWSELPRPGDDEAAVFD